jgi:AcrR family transcriptional regulator
MRADAARNLDTVLQTGARLLAADPTTSIATIAAEAGVDRRTVYRRFASREALLAAVYDAKFDDAERAFAAARLEEAPVEVALHRYVEEIVQVSRRWPVDITRMRKSPAAKRSQQLSDRLDAFVERAAAAGLLRADLPAGWASALLRKLVDTAAHEMTDLDPARAADLVVTSILNGIGGGR